MTEQKRKGDELLRRLFTELLFEYAALQRYEQFKAQEYHRREFTLVVNDQGGTDCNAEMRRIYEEPLVQV